MDCFLPGIMILIDSQLFIQGQGDSGRLITRPYHTHNAKLVLILILNLYQLLQLWGETLHHHKGFGDLNINANFSQLVLQTLSVVQTVHQ